MRSARILPFAAAILLAACTPPTQYPDGKQAHTAAEPPVQRERIAYLKRTAATPVTCTNGTDCKEKWARAQIWVTQHSTYSVKTTTDTEIATYGPIEPTTDAAYTVKKTPGENNTSTIEFTADCGNANGKPARCVPTALEQDATFKNYLLTGTNNGGDY